MLVNTSKLTISIAVSLLVSTFLYFGMIQNQLSVKEISVKSIEDLNTSFTGNIYTTITATPSPFFKIKSVDGNYYFSTNEYGNKLIVRSDKSLDGQVLSIYGRIINIEDVEGFEKILEKLNQPLEEVLGNQIDFSTLSEEELSIINSTFDENVKILIPASRIEDQRIVLLAEYVFTFLIITGFLAVAIGAFELKTKEQLL